MLTFVGTSGFSYKEWKGVFYPPDLPASGMLAYYARHFDTVEINNTFYRMPTEKLLLQWAADVPEDFTFVLKAPRRITHLKQLDDARAEFDHFSRTARVLERRLGPTLIQLPPFLRCDLDTLRGFDRLLPPGWPAAYEFRHQSWFRPEVYEILRESGRALVFAESDDEKWTPELVPTADWGYVRLRRPDYSDPDLAEWGRRLTALGWSRLYVFFKHEDSGAGPRLAARFRELLPGQAVGGGQ